MGDTRSLNVWPLVGRTAALRGITEAAAREDVRGVVVVGPPGVGRTRLAREAVTALAAAGHRTAWATGTGAAGTITFGALLHLVAMEEVATAGYVFGRLVERLSAPGGRRPVLVVDDAHLLDDASAALVHHLAVHTTTFVLLTLRPGRATPDVVTALWKEQVARRVELEPLGGGDVDMLLERALGGQMDAVSRRTLRRLSAGNPLVLREVVRAGLERSALRRVDGVWHLAAPVEVTGRLGDVIEEQMKADDPVVRNVLEVLACAEPLGQPVLEAITGHAAVVQAERQGLVVVEPSGLRHQARLAMPAYGDVIRARMPRAQARAIWRQLAESLATSAHLRADDALDLAVWRLNAGLDSYAPELLAGAERAAERLELGIAERLASASRENGGGVEADLTLAEVLALQGRYADAAAVLPTRERCDGKATTDRWAMLAEKIEYWSQEDSSDPGLPAGERAAEAVRAWALLLEGRVKQALQVGTALLARPDPELAARATVWAATAVTLAAGLVGDIALAERASAIGRDVAHTHRTVLPWGPVQIGGARCLALMLSGDLAAAATAVESGYREAVETEAAPLVGAWASIRGIVAKAQGRVQLAQEALREAVVLLDGYDALRFQQLYMAELAGTHALAGDTIQAETWLDRVDGMPPAPGVLFDWWIDRNRAWTAAAMLDLSGAANLAIEAAKAARVGAPAIEALALFDAVRFGAAGDVCERLKELAAETPTPTTAAFVAAATAYATDNARQLTEAAGALRDLGHLLPAAEAAATAYRLHVREGRRTAAKNTLALARELLAECGRARTRLTDLTGSEASLTPRELQVAKLVAAGLSGRAVADRLGLSLRTVNNHLGRIYVKLGVSGRQALADVLGQ
ncbi:LuxR C-terminal-related transcriptional regulator [Acrocarpospora sp. B8E8]|uniref:helix-turn-helix transcriptional regulator n=1 Tax=Acrocarpospora sp. B8E8 TaxID=3153572 RepID=UPI00325F13EE